MKNIMLAQSIYFLVTALWPIIDVESFMYITGPKEDVWLLKLVSALLLVIGITIFIDVLNKQPSIPVIVLALLSAMALVISDVFYVLKGVIRSVYLVDAAVVTLIIIGILFTLLKQYKRLELNREIK